ncbi:hypothetical protein EDB89DRAFT_2079604 [Lactarius sanguifluus]|nr:hypothetical protein EDB89DRAFT_2079604 [Lactarius sanguifluus]
MEDEDKTIRALIVPFLAQAASSRSCRVKDTLIKAVSKSFAADVAKIIEDILVFLPSFNDGQTTRRGNELVHFLRAVLALREDLAPGRNPANLEQSRGYLELSYLLPPRMALQIQCSSCAPTALARLAGALLVCSHQKSPESSTLALMRRQVELALSSRQMRKDRAKFYYNMPAGWVDCDLLMNVDEQQSTEPRVETGSRVCLQALLLCPPQTLPFFGTLNQALTRHSPPAKPPPSPPPDTNEFVDAPPSKRKAGRQEQNGTQKLSIQGQHLCVLIPEVGPYRGHSKDQFAKFSSHLVPALVSSRSESLPPSSVRLRTGSRHHERSGLGFSVPPL